MLCAGSLVPRELWSGAGAGPVVARELLVRRTEGVADPVWPKRSGAVRGRRSAGRICPRLDVTGVFWQWLLRGPRGPAHHRVRPRCTCKALTLTATQTGTAMRVCLAPFTAQVRETSAYGPIQSAFMSLTETPDLQQAPQV